MLYKINKIGQASIPLFTSTIIDHIRIIHNQFTNMRFPKIEDLLSKQAIILILTMVRNIQCQVKLSYK